MKGRLMICNAYLLEKNYLALKSVWFGNEEKHKGE